jgi:hypothetical protein
MSRERDVYAARKTCSGGVTTSSVLSRRQVSSRRDSRIKDIPDRLAEDARIFLLMVERQQTSYDVVLDALVRDAFGSADRLRAAAAAARACGWPTAEADLLEWAADRAQHARPARPHTGRLGAGTVAAGRHDRQRRCS